MEQLKAKLKETMAENSQMKDTIKDLETKLKLT